MRWALKWTQVWQESPVQQQLFSPCHPCTDTRPWAICHFLSGLPREVMATDNGREAPGSVGDPSGSSRPGGQAGLQNTQQPSLTDSLPLGDCPNHRAWEPAWHSPALSQEPFDGSFAKHVCVGGRGSRAVVPLPFLPSFLPYFSTNIWMLCPALSSFGMEVLTCFFRRDSGGGQGPINFPSAGKATEAAQGTGVLHASPQAWVSFGIWMLLDTRGSTQSCKKPGGLNSTIPGLAHLALAHAGFWFPV